MKDRAVWRGAARLLAVWIALAPTGIAQAEITVSWQLAQAAEPPAGLISDLAQSSAPSFANERQQVLSIQEALALLDYDVGTVDGFLGPRTRQAIRDFQADNDLAVTGAPSELLIGALRRVLARAAGPSTIDEAHADSSRIDLPGIGLPGALVPPDAAPALVSEPQDPELTLSLRATDLMPAIDPPPGIAVGTVASGSPTVVDAPGLRAETREEMSVRLAAGLPGSRWRFTDDTNARLILQFRENGEIAGPAVGGVWSWAFEDGWLVIRFDAGMGLTVTRRATEMRHDRMMGTGESSQDRSWDWEAQRMN